jgi:hypothetical protein
MRFSQGDDANRNDEASQSRQTKRAVMLTNRAVMLRQSRQKRK